MEANFNISMYTVSLVEDASAHACTQQVLGGSLTKITTDRKIANDTMKKKLVSNAQLYQRSSELAHESNKINTYIRGSNSAFYRNKLFFDKWNLLEVYSSNIRTRTDWCYTTLVDSEILMLKWLPSSRLLKAGIIWSTAHRPMHSLTKRKRSVAKTWHKFRRRIS